MESDQTAPLGAVRSGFTLFVCMPILVLDVIIYMQQITSADNIFRCIYFIASEELIKVSKGAKIRNRYNQVPHLTQDTNGKDKLGLFISVVQTLFIIQN